MGQGENKLVFDDVSKNFLFGQKGTVATTGTRYKIIGFRMKTSINGTTYTTYARVGNSIKLKDERVSGSLKYTLWNISIDEMYDQFVASYGKLDAFLEFYNRNIVTEFRFDSIMTYDTHNGTSWVQQGDIYNNGNGAWGTVWREPNELPSWVPASEKFALWDIMGTLPAQHKIPYITPESNGLLVGPDEWGEYPQYPKTHYHKPGTNDYWVNLKDPFTVFVGASLRNDQWFGKNQFPTHNYMILEGNGVLNNAWAMNGSNNMNTWGGFGDNFKNLTTTSWQEVSGNINRLQTHFRMTATQDARDYYFRYLSEWNGSNTGYKETGRWLKTDGSPPASAWNQATGVNERNVEILQQAIFDARSGVDTTKGSTYAIIKHNNISSKKIDLSAGVTYPNDYSATVNIDDYFPGKNGDMEVSVFSTDNVGNTGLISKKTIKVVETNPINVTVNIEKFKYQDATTKWVKANDEFEVVQRGYGVSLAPTGSHIRMTPEGQTNPGGTMNFATTMKLADRWEWENNKKSLKINRYNFLSQWDENNNKYAGGRHYLVADETLNGKKFIVHGLSERAISTGQINSEWKTDSKLLGVDGVGPRIKGIPSDDWTKNTVNINLTATDAESGMLSLEIFKGNTRVDSGVNSVSIDNIPEGTHTYRYKAVDNVGNVTEDTFVVNRDISAPIITSANAVNDFDDFTVNVNGIKDKNINGGAGNESVQLIAYRTLNNTIKKTITLPVALENVNVSQVFNRSNLTDIFAYDTEYTVEVWTADILGNRTQRAIVKATIYNPTPLNGNLTVSRYDYKEPSSEVYWVKPSSIANVIINTESYFPNNYPVYPTETQVGFGTPGYSEGTSPQHYANKTAKGKRGSQYDTNFNFFVNSSERAVEQSGSKRITFAHNISAKLDNRDYTLNIGSAYNSFDIMTNSNKLLKTDGTKPTVTGIPSSNWTKNNVTINISASDSRSGMDTLVLYKGSTIVASGTTSVTYPEINEGKHIYRIVASDNVGNVEDKTFNINIDKSAPTITNANAVNDFDDFTINVNGIKDKNANDGAGNESVQLIAYRTLNNTIKKTITLPVALENVNVSQVFNRSNLTDIFAYDTEYTVEVWTEDILTNRTKRATVKAIIYNPTPLNGNLTVSRYDYKEPSSEVYWVKPSSIANVTINTESYFPNNYPVYPTETQVGFGTPGYSEGTSPQHYANKTAKGKRGNQYDTNFNFFVNSSERAVEQSGSKRITFAHNLSAKLDNRDYTLNIGSAYNSFDIMTNSNKLLKTDGTKPTVTGIPSPNWTKNNVTINISASDSRSGMDTLVLYKGSNIVASGTTSVTYPEINEGKHIYRIVATDNVGNVEDKTFNINIDKSAPTITTANAVNDFDRFTVNVNGIKDKNTNDGVGNENVQLIAYRTLNNTIKKAITLPVVLENANVSQVFNRSNLADIFVYDTEYTVEVWTEDILGNRTQRAIVKAIIYNPTPLNGNLTVSRYDYKQPNQEIYWVRPSSIANITINTEAYFPNNYPVYPTETQVGFGTPGYSDGTSPLHYATKHGKGTRGSQYFSNFNFFQNSEKATEESGSKKIIFAHNISAQLDNKDYDLKVGAAYNSFDIINNTNKYLKTDGTAPAHTNNRTLDRKEDTFKIGVDVTDLRSGVKTVVASVWVDEGNGRLHQQNINAAKTSGNTYEFTVNRANFGNNRRNYYWQYTFTDNVGNVSASQVYGPEKMLQYNLTANRIDMFDPRDNRYVSQLVAGFEYEAVIEFQNTGELKIKPNTNFGVQLKETNNNLNKININDEIAINQIVNYRIRFRAGNDENLRGTVYSALIDSTNIIDEINEDDNICSTQKPYTTPVSEINPPIIPIKPPLPGKPDPVPLITVKVDLRADDVEALEFGNTSDKRDDDIAILDKVKVRSRFSNQSSLPLRNLDILNKNFDVKTFYDNNVINTTSFSDMSFKEQKTIYQDFTITDILSEVIDVNKEFKVEVDYGNKVAESNESNNIATNLRKITVLKLENYRVTSIIHPPVIYNYPIFTPNMPVVSKAGYQVSFEADVIGRPKRVYAELSQTDGTPLGIVEMRKTKTISPVRSEWAYDYAPSVDTKEGTIIISKVFASNGAALYDHNRVENWNGHSIRIGESAVEDIIIYRKH